MKANELIQQPYFAFNSFNDKESELTGKLSIRVPNKSNTTTRKFISFYLINKTIIFDLKTQNHKEKTRKREQAAAEIIPFIYLPSLIADLNPYFCPPAAGRAEGKVSSGELPGE